MIGSGPTEKGRIAIMGAKDEEITRGNRDSFDEELFEAGRFVSKPIIEIVMLKTLHFKLMLFEIGNKQLWRKDVVRTIRHIDSRDVFERMDMPTVRAKMKRYMCADSSGESGGPIDSFDAAFAH